MGFSSKMLLVFFLLAAFGLFARGDDAATQLAQDIVGDIHEGAVVSQRKVTEIIELTRALPSETEVGNSSSTTEVKRCLSSMVDLVKTPEELSSLLGYFAEVRAQLGLSDKLESTQMDALAVYNGVVSLLHSAY
jgi:hypothetical protein